MLNVLIPLLLTLMATAILSYQISALIAVS